MTQGLFDEPTPNRVAHTPYSLAFSRNEDYRQVVLLQTGFFAPMMKSLYEAVKSSEAAKGRSAFNLAMETDDPFYAYVSKHPELTKRFGASMRFVSSAEDTSPQFLSDGFDWARLGKAHVVDVSILEFEPISACVMVCTNRVLTTEWAVNRSVARWVMSARPLQRHFHCCTLRYKICLPWSPEPKRRHRRRCHS